MCDQEPPSVDTALRERIAEALGPGDVVVSWLAIAGVRHMNGGGYVITVCSEDMPPLWQLRGMWTEAEADITRGQLMSELDEYGDH